METDMNRLTLVLANALAATLIATPVHAKITEATLQYDPVELATPDGAANVYERLRLSAKRACEVPSPIQQRQQFDCRREIENDLLAQIGSPTLFAMHRDAQRALRIARSD